MLALAPRLLNRSTLAAVTLGATSLPGAAQGPRLEALHRMLPVDQTITEVVLLADVDGDGDVDLVTGNRPWLLLPSPYDERGQLYLNDGSGRFTQAVGHLPGTKAATYALASADVDGDGDLDLVVGNDDGYSGDELWLNDGSGHFLAVASAIAVPNKETRALAAGDVDGDGDVDLLIGGSDGDDLWTNDGLGGFANASGQLPVTNDDTDALGLCDVDRDGDLDALRLADYEAELWLNDGLGTFNPAPWLLPYSMTKGYVHMAFADVDADGDQDLLLVDIQAGPDLWLNDGQGLFSTAPGRLPPPPVTTVWVSNGDYQAIATGDVDGDGDLDAVVGGGQHTLLYVNDGQGFFRLSRLPAIDRDAETPALAMADLDADGDADVVCGTWSYWDMVDLQNRLLLGQKDGRLVDVTGPGFRALRESTVLAAADTDGDGDKDLFVGTQIPDPKPVRLLVNDGTGNLSCAPDAHFPTAGSAHSLAAADVDEDGDQDLVIGGGSSCSLWLNDGEGRFAEAPGAFPPAPSPETLTMALADVDLDGDPDLLRGNSWHCTLWLNDGSGHFADASDLLPPLKGWVGWLVLEDLDGDGDLDALIAGGKLSGDTPSNGVLWLNDGQGRFVDESSRLPAGDGQWGVLASEDVDGDGDSDVLVSIRPPWGWPGDSRMHLLLNDGAARFHLAEGAIQVTDTVPSTLALLDADEDGDLDLALAGPYEAPTRLLTNDGTGRFESVHEPLQVLPRIKDLWLTLLATDLDGDGDLELVQGGAHRLLIYTNLSRQLTWRSLPRVGGPLVLDLYGRAQQAWVLSHAPLATGEPLPPARPWTVLAAGVLDQGGRASWSIDVPPFAALVGRTWVWRASIGGRRSNLEATTFLGP